MGKIFDYDGVPVLHTTSGDLKGYFYDGVYIYKGIPYAYACLLYTSDAADEL